MAADAGRMVASVVLVVCAVFASVVSAQEDILQYQVIEETPSGTFVGNVREDSKLRSTASQEEFSQLIYSILSTGQSYESLFTVNSANGTLFTAVQIDRETLSVCAYETTCNLTISIVARATVSSFYRTLKVRITVQDINDHAPTFSKLRTTVNISELATIGSSMSLVGAVDADTGLFSLQRYYIMNEDSLNLPFTTSYERYVDGSSVVKLQITGDLDREQTDSYHVVIVAEDGGDPRLTGTMTVDVNIEDTNDNPPVFDMPTYNVTINETISVGTGILTLSASDADLGVNAEIEYRLSRNQIGKIQEQFSLNETSGTLSVKQKFASGGEYRIIIEASDKGAQPLMSQVVVVVTVLDSDNNQPTINVNLFSDSNLGTVSEYADIGTVVAHVMIRDSDTGVNGIIECTIDSDDEVFKLQNYDVNQYKVIVAQKIDREILDFIYVIINCNDKGSPPQTTFAEFTVRVIDENDNPPKFLQQIYFVDIPENNLPNIDIVHVSAVDKDVGDNGDVSYSVWAPGNYRFSMDPFSGIIQTQSVFDREIDEKIILFAYAKDNGVPQRTSTATIQINVIDVNDNDPEFTEPLYVFYVSENMESGTSVGRVAASDNDTGNNALLGLHVDPALPFTIDATGVIRTNDNLDREDTHTYSFLVTAFDHGVPSRNTSSNVVVQVNDVNDHAPRFVFPDSDNITVEMDATTVSEAVVAIIKAFDLDEGVNSQLRYSIVNTNVTDIFAIDGNTGELTLKRPLSDLDQSVYNIQLRVEDRGNPILSASTAINVFIARRVTPAPATGNNGENLLIAVTLSAVTFVLVFTIVLVICILRRRWFQGDKDRSDSEDRFYDKAQGTEGRRVKFAMDPEIMSSSQHSDVTKNVHEPMTSFFSDGNESRDSDMTSSTVDMETPILDRQKISREKMSPRESLPGIAESYEMHHSTPRSDVTQPRPGGDKPRYDISKPRYENMSQLHALQTHSSILNSAIKPAPVTSAHDDNHSQTSGETVTSDSGRGGSESDIHSASLSHSHDSDLRGPGETRYLHDPAHSTLMEPPKPWLNLADLRHHHCNKLPVAKQLHDDRKHRLQLRNLADRKSARPASGVHNSLQHKPFQTQSDRHLNRVQGVTSPQGQSKNFPAPPSDIDRSFMTYDDEDDDLSTTTSGSYTIDQEDISLDFRSPLPNTSGLKSCLV